MDKLLKTLYIYFILLISIVFVQNLYALMPPHVTGSLPENGGVISGNTLEIYGYSLTYSDIGDYQIIDLTTNGPVETTSELSCEWVGEGDCPGCKQQSCVFLIILQQTLQGHEYKVTFSDSNLDFELNFTCCSDEIEIEENSESNETGTADEILENDTTAENPAGDDGGNCFTNSLLQ